MTGSPVAVRWPTVPAGRPHYESLFLRAVDPVTGAAVWLRHTMQRTPGRGRGATTTPRGLRDTTTAAHRPGDATRDPDRGALWCTLWSADGRPHATKRSAGSLRAPAHDGTGSAWISVGDDPGDPGVASPAHDAGDASRGSSVVRVGITGGTPPSGASAGPPAAAGERGMDGSSLGPDGTVGAISMSDERPGARWDLTFAGGGEPLAHLPFPGLYGSPLPRTKPTSPRPEWRISGTVAVGGVTVTLDDAPGVLGHNWGSEHAHRWLWLHGTGFDAAPDTWIDVAMARVRVGSGRASLTLPWAAVGALSLHGRRIPLGLSARRRPGRVRHWSPGRTVVELPAADGHVEVEHHTPPEQMVAWIYADAAGGEDHHALNGSRTAVRVTWVPRRGAPVTVEAPFGGVLEQGIPADEPHPVPVLPFADG
ncbi:MAG: hypothetical protein AB7G37_08860 [Solirubrobacteraceae bacterium]